MIHVAFLLFIAVLGASKHTFLFNCHQEFFLKQFWCIHLNDLHILLFSLPRLDSDPKTIKSVERILSIWEERDVYSGTLVTDLRNILVKEESPPETPVERKSEWNAGTHTVETRYLHALQKKN